MVKPKSTTLDLTEACNLACDYCFTWSKHKPRKLNLELGKRIINWWLPQTEEGNVQVSFWGGEPLLEWGMLKKLVHHTNELNKRYNRVLEYGGTTNGLLYTPDKVEWCLEHKSLFLVSLDGIQPVHDAHRKTPNGKGSWKIVDKNLREALKITPLQRIRSAISADSVEYFYENLLYFVEDLGISNFAFSPVFECDWDEKAIDTLSEQFELAINYIVKKAKEGKEIILKHLNDEANISKISNKTIQNPCGAGSGYTGWSVDGFMFPCHRFNKHGITTKERSKSALIIARPKGNSFEYCNKEWRKQFIEWKDNVPKQCKNCSIFGTSVCNGGCYAVNWDLTGSLIKQPKSVCDYNKIQHEAGLKYAKLAKENEINIPSPGWGENIQPTSNLQSSDESCVCYNMCYMEGTQNEIIHIDRRSDSMCICYNTSYTGSRDPQHRTVEELDKQKEAERRIINAASNFVESSSEVKK